MTAAYQTTLRVTTRLRVISITLGTIVLAIVFPLTLFIALGAYTDSVDGSFSTGALDWFGGFVVIFVLPGILGTIFWYASWCLRQRSTVRVFAESSCLVFVYLIAGPLLAALSQAWSASISGDHYVQPPFLDTISPTMAAQSDVFTNALNLFWHYVLGWLPISFAPMQVWQVPMLGFLAILALGEGALGTGLAHSLARWNSIRTRSLLTAPLADWREVARAFGVNVLMLIGINAIYGLPLWPRYSHSLIMLIFLVLVLPTVIPCLITGMQTLMLLRKPPSAVSASSTTEPDNYVDFSFEQIPDR